jgi:hypothetical protein
VASRGTKLALGAGWAVLAAAGGVATLVLNDGVEGSSQRYRWEEHSPEAPVREPPTPAGEGSSCGSSGPSGPSGPAEPLEDGRIEFRVCTRPVPEPSSGIPSRWAPLEGSSPRPYADHLRSRGIAPGRAG